MEILVIDAQGGGLGKQIISAVKKKYPETEITAVGTNSLATQNMLKGGADHGATGENAVVVCCRTAKLIICPIGAVIADSMYGEITPGMAKAIGQSPADRLLIPMNQCGNIVMGLPRFTVANAIESVLAYLEHLKQP